MRGFNISYKCLLLAMLTTALLPSCNVWQDDLDGSEDGAENVNEFILNMNITARQIDTRATEHEGRDNGTAADNFINIDGGDYCVYILDGSNNSVITKFTPSLTTKTADGSYRLSGKFTYDPTKMTTFRLMVMANWQAFGGDYSANITDGSTVLSSLYSDRTNFNFTYQPTTTTDKDGKQSSWSWVPAGDETDNRQRQGIPMFGLSDVITIPKFKYGFVPELEVGSIPMLRALAKIVVVNAIDESTQKEEVEILSCKLTKYNSNGRFIPNGTENPDWNKEETQVTNPTLPITSPSLPEQTDQEKDLLFIPSSDKKTFTAYVHEMIVKSLQEKPYIEVEAKVGNEEARKYTIQLGKYSDNYEFLWDSYFEAILRNHRYQYDVMSIIHGIHLDNPKDWDGWFDGFNNKEN